MKSSFLPKYEQKIVRTQGRNPDNFSFVFWEKQLLHKFILKLTGLQTQSELFRQFLDTCYIYSMLKLLFQTSKVEWQEASGLREKIRGELNLVQKEMTSLRTKQESQQQLIENQLRSVSISMNSVMEHKSRVHKIQVDSKIVIEKVVQKFVRKCPHQNCSLDPILF